MIIGLLYPVLSSPAPRANPAVAAPLSISFLLFIGLGERPTPIDRSGRISHALEAQKARARARTENTPNDAEMRLPGQ